MLIDSLYFEAGNSSNFFTLENKVYIFGLVIFCALNIEITRKYTIAFGAISSVCQKGYEVKSDSDQPNYLYTLCEK